MALVVLGLKIKCKVKELNCFSQHVCINGTLVFRIALDFIGDAQFWPPLVLDVSYLLSPLHCSVALSVF